MKEQVFISYRRDGGDVTAKLICESLKNHGYSVFYDFDSLSGGYFDDRIIEAIEGCKDFILVLPKNSLDRCVNEDDWVRLEIECAMKNRKNLIPVMLPDFTFPGNLPQSIKDLPRVNAVTFVMAYFDGVIATLIDRMISKPVRSFAAPAQALTPSDGLEFVFHDDVNGYAVKVGKCKDSHIIVPRTHQGKAVNAVAEDGFRDCSALQKITLPDTITRIDDSAFQGCTILDEIIIPDKVTHIGAWAFYQCTSLTQINIPKNVRNIGKRAFARCASVEKFSVDALNMFFCAVENHLYSKDRKTFYNYACAVNEPSFSVPEGVTKIADCAFAQCTSLASVSLPDSVDEICDFAFIDCSALTDVRMPAHLERLGECAFKACSSLIDIKVPYGVTDIDEYCFWHCASLKSAALPDTVTNIGKSAFNGCDSLRNISIPEKVTSIGQSAFYECKSLRNITIPEKVTSIDGWAFYKCTSLNTIVIPRNVSNIGKRAFTDCSSLMKFIVDPQNPYYCNVGNHLFTKDKKAFVAFAPSCGETAYAVPEGVERVEDSAFSECKSLKSITLPESVDYIGNFAFIDCSSLMDLSLPRRAVTLESSAFKRCVSLTSITVPNGIQYIEEDTFRECAKLKKVVLPDTVTSIGKSAFNECTALESLDIPPKVSYIGPWAFYGCTKLLKIKLPKTLTSIGNRGFAESTSLMSISVSMFNRNYCSVGKHLYTKDKKTLVQYAVGSKDKSFVVPEGVTTIGDCAFSKCENLESVTIPKSVTCFEDYAWDKCTKLKQMTFEGTVEMWNKIRIGKSALRKIGAQTVKCADGNVTL